MPGPMELLLPMPLPNICRLPRGARPVSPLVKPLLAALLAISTASPLAAQRIGLAVGDSARMQFSGAEKIAVPVRVDMSAAGGGNLAAFEASLSWGATRLTFDSLRAAGASGLSVTTNSSNATGGSVALSAFSPSGLTSSGLLLTAYFTVGQLAGGTRVTFTPTVAAGDAGQSVLPLVAVRNLDVCVVPTAKWGDVNDDNSVNIIDAQQIARHTVGLSVANTTVLRDRGDVTGDGNINIIDAQQIARYTVGLSTGGRIAVLRFQPAAPTTLALAPSSAQTLRAGATVQLTATPRDDQGNDLGGCAPVTWRSADSTIARVSSTGLVTGVALGATSVTATAGGLTATVPIAVQATSVLAVTTQPVGSVSNTVLATQPVVELRGANGAVITDAPTAITASLTGATGTLSGATTVTTVNGVARFTDLAITGTGSHTLTFSASGASSATASPLTVTAPTTMRLLVGTTPTLMGAAGTDLPLPLVLDLAGRGTNNLASITVTLTWDPARFTYVGNQAGTWVDQAGGASSVTVNATNAATGTLSISGFTTEATIANATLRTLTLRPVASGPVVVTATVTAAGNIQGQSVTVTPRNLGSAAPPPTSQASVTVAPTTAALVVGQTTALSATVRDATGATVPGAVVTWSASDTTIARVSSAGVVTAVRAGTATITATRNGLSGSATVTVTAATVASVTVTPTTATVGIGQTTTLAATLRDAGGNTLTGLTVTWSSSDTTMATVSSGGVVTGVRAGTATITAARDGRSGTATLTVSANTLTTISGLLVSSSYARYSQGNCCGPTASVQRQSLVRVSTVSGTNSVTAAPTMQVSVRHPWVDVRRNRVIYVGERASRAVLLSSTLAGGDLRVILRADSAQTLSFPSVSPDGSKVAYIRSEGTGTRYLAIRPSDGTGTETRIATISTAGAMAMMDERPAQWSPDGTRLLFSVYVQSAYGTLRQLHSATVTGTDLRALGTEVNVATFDAVWSPDGARLAYVRQPQGTSTGAAELWTMRADGTQAARLGTAQGTRPLWAPGGQAILHICGSNTQTTCATTSDGATSVTWATSTFEETTQWLDTTLTAFPAALVGGELRGRVLDAADTTRGLTGVSIAVRIRGGGVISNGGCCGNTGVVSTTTDGNGFWTVSGILPDTVDVTASLTGFSSDSVRSLVVVNGQSQVIPNLSIRRLIGLRADPATPVPAPVPALPPASALRSGGTNPPKRPANLNPVSLSRATHADTATSGYPTGELPRR